MIFIVPEDFKGSCVLNTLKKVLWKGITVSIYGDDLYASDVKLAIKRGVLVPLGEEYDEKKASLSCDAMIINKTDKTLALGKIILKPWASLMVNKSILRKTVIQSAEKNGFISIISDEVKYTSEKMKKPKSKKQIKKVTKNKKTSANKKDVNVIEIKEEKPICSAPKTGADKDVNPTVWNFRDKNMEDAQSVPKISDITTVNEDTTEEVDFVNDEEKAKKEAKNKKKRQKTVKKKISKKTIKKKGKVVKKKKVKLVEPVGDKRIPKTQDDAAIELDSRGNPINNASDTLQHLIDSLTEQSDISFVDDK